MLGKGALVAEAEVQSDFGNGFVAAPEHFAGGLNSRLDEESAGVRPEDLAKSAVELTDRHAGSLCQIGKIDRLMKMVADIADGPVDLKMGRQGGSTAGVALYCPHDPDDGTSAAEDGKLVSEVPVGQALEVEKKFNDFQLRFTRSDDLFVILPEFAGKLFREKFEIIFSDNIRF